MTPEKLSTNSLSAPTQDEIALRAHQLWMEQGCPHGHDVDNWLEAERQLNEREIGSSRRSDALPQRGVPAAEDVDTSAVARPDEPYAPLRDEAPLATRVEEELIDTGRPASRRSKTSLNL